MIVRKTVCAMCKLGIAARQDTCRAYLLIRQEHLLLSSMAQVVHSIPINERTHSRSNPVADSADRENSTDAKDESPLATLVVQQGMRGCYKHENK